MNSRWLITCCLAAVVATSAIAPAEDFLPEGKDAASIIPEDAFLFIHVPDVSAVTEAFKKTSTWGLYREPAMQQFVEPAEKAVREFIDEKLREAWKEMEITDPPEDLPIPAGRVIVAVRMGKKVMMVPKYDYDNYDWENDNGTGPPVSGVKEITVSDPQVVLIADMGEKIETVRQLAEQAAEKAADNGWQLRRDTIGGLEVQIMTAPVPKRPDNIPADIEYTPPSPAPFGFAFEGSMAIFGNLEMLRSVAERMNNSQMPSLADDDGLKKIMRQLDAPGEASLYLNVSALISSTMDSVGDEADKARAEGLMTALGLDNVEGLGLVVRLAPNEAENYRIKGMLGVRGEKRGIPALLTPKTASTEASRLVTKGVASVFVGNYSLGKIYEQVIQIAQGAGVPGLGMRLQMIMAMTGTPDGQPPVDAKKEVFDQAISPITVLHNINRPYSDPSASKVMLAIGVNDASILDGALDRMHNTFIARGKPEMRRELLGSNIFLIPGGGPTRLFTGPPSDADGSPEPIAIAVAGDNLVVGSESTVAQAIRDLRRTDIEPIQADPMYGHVKRFLPAEAGAWFYSNDQISGASYWAQYKEAARKVAQQPEGEQEGHEGHDHSNNSPLEGLIKKLAKVCDFNRLPDFEAVRQYFGATTGYVKGTEDGIIFEIVTVKAPKAE